MFQAVYMALKPRLKEILTDEQSLILHLYLMENVGLMEIAERLNFSDYHVVKEELKEIELKVLALA